MGSYGESLGASQGAQRCNAGWDGTPPGKPRRGPVDLGKPGGAAGGRGSGNGLCMLCSRFGVGVVVGLLSVLSFLALLVADQ